MIGSIKHKMEKVVEAVSIIHGVPVNYIRSTSRVREVVDAKKMFTFYVRNRYGIGYADITKFLNLKDHTTTIHHFRCLSDVPETDFEEHDRIKVETKRIDRFIESGRIQPLCQNWKVELVCLC